MLRAFFATVLLTAATGFAEPPWLNGESRPEDLRIFLVTFGPGGDVPSWFGHGALGVEDTRLKRSALYNFGMFSFDETMLARFAMGRLWFWVEAMPVAPVLRFYERHDRWVHTQILALEPDRTAELAKRLAVNVLPENKHYLYHHYNDNCVTRLRDGIDSALGGQLREAARAPARMTLRGHTRRYSAANAGMSLLLDYLMNDEIDQPITQWEEMFLPAELERHVAQLRYKRSNGEALPLVEKQWENAKSTRPPPPDSPPPYGPYTWAVGIALGAFAVLLGGRQSRRGLGAFNALIGLVFGIPGLCLMLMWLFTEHTVCWRNENLLLANPLTFLALPLGIAALVGSRRVLPVLRAIWIALAITGLLAVLLKVLPMFDQDNARIIGLIWPCSVGLAAAHILLLRRAAIPVSS